MTRGFSPERLGLGKWPINSPFRKPRTGSDGRVCPHSGIDIATGGNNLRFQAGIFGTVVITGGDTNRIEVAQFGDSAHVIRYLHCETHAVSRGDSVAPWTTLGTTGTRGGGSTGVHLHLDVVARGVPSSEPSCWSQEYVDPLRYSIRDVPSGFWYHQEGSGPNYDLWQTLSVAGTELGNRVELQLHAFYQGQRCQWFKTSSYSGIVSSHSGNAAFVDFTPAWCRTDGDPRCQPARCQTAQPFRSKLVLDGGRSLLLGSRSRFVRRKNLPAAVHDNRKRQETTANLDESAAVFSFIDIDEGRQSETTLRSSFRADRALTTESDDEEFWCP